VCNQIHLLQQELQYVEVVGVHVILVGELKEFNHIRVWITAGLKIYVRG
jgi:hypothetical protein